MIKAAGTSRQDGRPVVILGLSRSNTEKLLLGQPISVDTETEFGIEGGPVIMIMGGETEEAMKRELERVVTLPAKA